MGNKWERECVCSRVEGWKSPSKRERELGGREGREGRGGER